jgi:hypothetical protein
LAFARVYGFLPRADKEPTSSMQRRGRRTGRRTGTAPLRHCGTSLSLRGRRTAPRKTDRDVAAGPPPCRTSSWSRGPYLRRRRGRRKLEKGKEGGRQGGAFIKKIRMRKCYDD